MKIIAAKRGNIAKFKKGDILQRLKPVNGDDSYLLESSDYIIIMGIKNNTQTYIPITNMHIENINICSIYGMAPVNLILYQKNKWVNNWIKVGYINLY